MLTTDCMIAEAPADDKSGGGMGGGMGGMGGMGSMGGMDM
jgi:chaperonin GroEL